MNNPSEAFYYEGQILHNWIGSPDRIMFDYSVNTGILFYVLNQITDEELDAFNNGKKSIGMTGLGDIMYFTFKVGNLPMIDAPYTPHLSNQTDFSKCLDDCTKNVAFILVDSENGEVKYCRSFNVTADFTDRIRNSIKALLSQPFNREEYFALLSRIQEKYSSEQIADACNFSSPLIEMCF